MIKIKLTQNKVALIDEIDYPLISKYKWYAFTPRKIWYAMRKIGNTRIYMHREILSAESKEEIDHINNDGLDNRRCNLRIATNSQNQANSIKRLNTSSIYKGVYWDESDKKWRSAIKYHRKTINLGYFNNEIDAAKVYDKSAKELFGEYAKINIEK